MAKLTIPPLAGLATHAQAARPGLSVDVTVDRLRRLAYLKRALVFIHAAKFNGLPEWEVKGAISLHLWQDAEHATWFRRRVTEMRTPPHHLDRAPEAVLAAWAGELGAAIHTGEFLVAIYEVVKPAVVAALQRHLAESNPLTDQPTRRLMRMALGEEEEQVAWGRAALAAWRADPAHAGQAAALDTWREQLTAWLAAAGGIWGDEPRPETVPQPARARGEQPETTRVPQRDRRFDRVWCSRGVVPGEDRPVHERLWWMMNVRLQEMHVSELIASVMADWRDQPWEFYHDLARYLWDETRHCMMGETAFAAQGVDITSIPSHTGFAEYPNTQLPPAERYAFLWGIEQGLMTKSGKQAEVALAQEGHDVLATAFQDFDWADEVLHAQIGRRWLEPAFASREAMNEAYERVRPRYDQMKDEDLALPGRDWWPEFYARHLADKLPAGSG
jgi:hypothetical protein